MSTKQQEYSQLDHALLQAVDTMAQGLAIASRQNRRTCVHCLHFQHMREECGLATPPVRPPARVIAFGCPRFEPDEVPF